MARALIEVGRPAPDFSLPATDIGELRLSNLRGRKVVLYFYPKDDTPGCTAEASAFRDNNAEMTRRGLALVGISRDSLESHLRFQAKYHLNFPLASDPDAAVHELYGAMKERKVVRTTFLIDEQGVIRRIWSPVKVEGHAAEVLAAAEELG